MMRHNMSIRPVHRIKHVVDVASSPNGGTQLSVPLITAVDAPVLANTAEVETGAKVNGIYLRVEIASIENIASAVPNCYMIIWKNGGANLTAPAANTVGPNDNKRYVIHQEMVMINNVSGGTPRTLFNGVIVIPKGFRRFGPNDVLSLEFLCPILNVAVCIQCHYKEFR